MDLTSPEAMVKLADDVRQQEAPFIAAASEAFTALFGSEYRRLRASCIESGDNTALLNVSVRCNFDPATRSVELVTSPAPVQSKPRRKAVAVTSR